MMHNYLITGGCGFIGKALVRRILSENAFSKIRILDNLSQGRPETLEGLKGIELIVGDIREEGVQNLCQGIDTVIHLAANTGVDQSVQNPAMDAQMNIEGTLNMLEGARKFKVKKFIFASSNAAVGNGEPPIHEEKIPRPASPYGVSKLAGESYCRVYAELYGIATAALRFGNAYGPGSSHKGSIVAKFIKQAFKEQPWEIFGDGSQTRDFIYVQDILSAILLAVKNAPAGSLYQIATCRETSVRELSIYLQELIQELTGRLIPLRYSEPRPGDVKRNFSDITKAEHELGFRPEYDLRRGLRETVLWFMEAHICQSH